MKTQRWIISLILGVTYFGLVVTRLAGEAVSMWGVLKDLGSTKMR